MFDQDIAKRSQNLGSAPACRTCGCTTAAACAPTCWWVEDDLCSSCAPAAQALIALGPLCPGCLHREVASSQFGCSRCWFKLPADLRGRVWRNYRKPILERIENLPALYAEAIVIWHPLIAPVPHG